MRAVVILDVNSDAEERDWERSFLERLDAEVLTCSGGGPNGCPIMQGLDCGLIHKADGILFQLDLEEEYNRGILEHYAAELDVPVRAVVTEDQIERYGPLLDQVEFVVGPVGPSKLDAFTAEVESELV